jgi:hypothetical protein
MSRHAADQAWERHGFRMVMGDIARIKRLVATNGSHLTVEMPRTRNGNRAVAVRLRCSWLPVVVGPDGNIVTVLPAHCLNPILHHIEAREREFSARPRSSAG